MAYIRNFHRTRLILRRARSRDSGDPAWWYRTLKDGTRVYLPVAYGVEFYGAKTVQSLILWRWCIAVATIGKECRGATFNNAPWVDERDGEIINSSRNSSEVSLMSRQYLDVLKGLIFSMHSRRFLASIVGAVLAWAGWKYGIPYEVQLTIQAPLVAFILGESWKDGKAAETAAKVTPLAGATLGKVAQNGSSAAQLHVQLTTDARQAIEEIRDFRDELKTLRDGEYLGHVGVDPQETNPFEPGESKPDSADGLSDHLPPGSVRVLTTPDDDGTPSE